MSVECQFSLEHDASKETEHMENQSDCEFKTVTSTLSGFKNMITELKFVKVIT